jgi:hypothetical protein
MIAHLLAVPQLFQKIFFVIAIIYENCNNTQNGILNHMLRTAILITIEIENSWDSELVRLVSWNSSL